MNKRKDARARRLVRDLELPKYHLDNPVAMKILGNAPSGIRRAALQRELDRVMPAVPNIDSGCLSRHSILVTIVIPGEVCDDSFATHAAAHREIARRIKPRLEAAVSVLPMVYTDYRLEKMKIRVTSTPHIPTKKKYKGRGEYQN